MRINKKLAGVVGALVMVLAGAVVVYAAWTVTGTGNGSANAASTVAVQIQPYAGVCPPALVPGGTGSVCGHFVNNNPFQVTMGGAGSTFYCNGQNPANSTGAAGTCNTANANGISSQTAACPGSFQLTINGVVTTFTTVYLNSAPDFASPGGVAVAANSNSVDFVFGSNVLTMDSHTLSQGGCQAALFYVPLKITGSAS